MTVTAFVKISAVAESLHSAIGAQNVPSNTVIMALAGALTLLAMAPVGSRIHDRAKPLLEGDKVADTTAFVKGAIDATSEPERKDVGRYDLVIVIPAFVVTELIEAFAMGFAIYLPFLIIDLVVSNVLLALGMQMMNPTQVSLPFKLLLFVAIDGWGLLAQALVTGYRVS